MGAQQPLASLDVGTRVPWAEEHRYLSVEPGGRSPDPRGTVAVLGDVRLLCESVALILKTASIPVEVVDPILFDGGRIRPEAVVLVVRHEAVLDDMLALVEGTWPTLNPVIVTPRGNRVRTRRCSAQLELETSVDCLVDTVERVLKGARVSNARSWRRESYGGRSEPDFLTPREHEILRLLGAGHSVTGIAAQLKISGNTVRTHIANARSKLGVHTRLDAVRLAQSRTHPAVPSWTT